tara:strand:- start:502 stop:1017 length:516 start_codon:yes stop_codon:yes gene_type:complete
MAYNQTYTEIKTLLKQSKRVSKQTMLKIAKLAIKETIMERLVDKETGKEIEVTWDSKLSDDLGLDSLDMVELVMFLEECFAVELTDDMAMEIVTVGDAIQAIKKAKSNKGKPKRIDPSKYNKPIVPNPDSPFMSKPAGQYIGSDLSSDETKKAMEKLHDDIRESKDSTELP